MIRDGDRTIILASGSSRRLYLLRQINIVPDKVISATIDETPLKNERPRDLALRLAQEKAQAVFTDHPGQIVLAADTVVACGRRILDKPETEQQARAHLSLLSGRQHRVYGGICVMAPEGRIVIRLCETRVRFKRLDDTEIAFYLESGEWQGKAGGYAIQGLAGAFVRHLSGSYSNVVGLSLYDTIQILGGIGLRRKG